MRSGIVNFHFSYIYLCIYINFDVIIVNFNGDRQKSTNVYIIALIIEYLEVMV